uniref:Uncharacterized protein n=1 Tax=Arachis duranensis TaxID=130453 RepID=N1NFX1_ARADU|nr:hypothetical protein ARAX_ADH51I17-83F22-001 [Arachis duranensis]
MAMCGRNGRDVCVAGMVEMCVWPEWSRGQDLSAILLVENRSSHFCRDKGVEKVERHSPSYCFLHILLLLQGGKAHSCDVERHSPSFMILLEMRNLETNVWDCLWHSQDLISYVRDTFTMLRTSSSDPILSCFFQMQVERHLARRLELLKGRNTLPPQLYDLSIRLRVVVCYIMVWSKQIRNGNGGGNEPGNEMNQGIITRAAGVNVDSAS